jgi:CheY-like chemotaxis protein
MSLQSLVFCPDEKIVRVLRRVLSDLEIAVERCSDADSAIRKLTRQRFEAVIVDCSDEDVASQVLKSARSAPCNKHAVAVAIVALQERQLAPQRRTGRAFVLINQSPRAADRLPRYFAPVKRERRLVFACPSKFCHNHQGLWRPAVCLSIRSGEAASLFHLAASQWGREYQFTLPGHIPSSGTWAK